VLNASFYPNYGLLFRPVIISTLGGDLYLHMEYTDSVYNSLVSVYLGNPSPPVNISVTVVTMPMVYLVWAGAILLNIGIAISLIYDIMGYHEDMRQEQQQEDPALRERGK
jgi:hypothetical protein